MQSDERNHLQMTTEATANTPLLEGKITKITGFGAFVELTDGRSGLIHISEIADGFVDDIHRFVTEGQEVKVVLVNTDPEARRAVRERAVLERRESAEKAVPRAPEASIARSRSRAGFLDSAAGFRLSAEEDRRGF